MSNLYINTILTTCVSINPNQFNNNIYMNLKKKLEKQLTKKCYKDYGYILKIYKILRHSIGKISPNNFMSASKFDIEFSCRLCKPINGSQIICQIKKVNSPLISAKNGPILVVIPNEFINGEIFYTDNNNNIRYIIDQKSHILKPNEFILVTLFRIVYNHGDNEIKTLGRLNNIATKDDVDKYYKDLYDTEDDIVEYDDYVSKQELGETKEET